MLAFAYSLYRRYLLSALFFDVQTRRRFETVLSQKKGIEVSVAYIYYAILITIIVSMDSIGFSRRVCRFLLLTSCTASFFCRYRLNLVIRGSNFNPETGEDENEATEANLLRKKVEKTSFKRWVDGNDSTRLKYWVSATC
jgi:hypothetical protein